MRHNLGQRLLIALGAMVAALFIAAWVTLGCNAKAVHASNDCTVLSAKPDATGTGTTVVFDCGVYDADGDHEIVTIDEPQWPPKE